MSQETGNLVYRVRRVRVNEHELEQLSGMTPAGLHWQATWRAPVALRIKDMGSQGKVTFLRGICYPVFRVSLALSS